jgi:hypothetical protein
VSLTPRQRPEREELEARGERPEAASPLAHFWAHLVLLRADRPADARVARKQLEDLALARGFRASYELGPDEPDTAAPDVSAWPLLALEMSESERAAL